MGKCCSSAFMGAAHDWLQTYGSHMVVLSASATTSATIASAALASAATPSGDYTQGVGDTSGVKVTIATHSGCTIDASGTATHICLYDLGDTWCYQTTCTSQALTSGTVDIPAWDVEILDPA